MLSYESKEKSMIVNFFQSFGIHIVLIATTFFFSYKKIKDGEIIRKFNISLVEKSVRVDVVSMPKFSLQELKELQKISGSLDQQVESESKEKVVDNSPVKEGDFLKEKKEEKKNLFDMLQQYSRKKVEHKKSVKKNSREKGAGGHERQIDKATRDKLKSLVFQGNKISEGESAFGDNQSGIRGTEFAKYSLSLPDMVRPYWKLPSYLKDKTIKCRIRIFLAADGKLLRANIFESSGNSEFDDKAMAAVKSATFPPLPESIKDKGPKGEILLGFPL